MKDNLLKQMRHIFMLHLLLFISTAGAWAQGNAVTGRVTDEKGAGLPGVTVVVKGTTVGTSTDGDGNFSLNVPNGNGTLVVSFIGYSPQEVPIDNRATVNITLAPDAKALSEVVVVGYGTQRKRDITSAVSNIDVKNVGDIPAPNVTRLIQGQAPGVVVKQTNGTPGREMEVRIRGIGSLGAGSAPLYVIDGFPVGTSVGQNLNPNDIESITVLKDAASTAIYGARGSNGVVLITTKSAKEGVVQLSVTADYGIQNIPNSRKTEMLNGVEFAQFKKDIFMDKIRYFENREPDIEEVPLDFRYPEQTQYSTNWFEEILNQNAPVQNYNVTLSEGKGPVQSVLSVGYFGQEGALISTDYDRFSVRANLGGQINRHISMGWNLNGTYSKQRVAHVDGRSALVGGSLIMDPREPVYNEDGTYNSYIGGHDGVFGFPNPVQSLNEINRNRGIGDLLSNGFLEVSFLKHFTFRSSVNARLIFNSYKEFVPSTIAGVNAPPPRPATGYEDFFQTVNVAADQLLTYAPELGDDHQLDVLVGYTAQEETTKGLSGSGNTYPDDLVPFLNAANIRTAGSTEFGWSLLAYLSRINYSFKDKYLLSASFNREGSSRFGVKNKWGNFPAASIGWRLSEEPFIPEYSWLTDLKIRGSWGMTGNNNIGNYSSLSFMSTNNYILGNNIANGKVISSFANTALGWEKSNQLDIGLDLAILNNSLVFTVEYYKKITNDMLLPIQLPAISGFTTSLANIGKVENKGFEFALDYNTQISAVNFRSNFNISFNRNKVLEIRGENDEIWTGSMYGGYNVSKVGRPIGMIYGYRMLGIFNNHEEIKAYPSHPGNIPGTYRYFDANGDGAISYDQKDMIEIGNPHPDFTWGWTLAADFKNFDFNVLFLGAQGYDLFRQIESSTMNMDGVFNVLTESKERWRSEQNPGAGKQGTTNTWMFARENNSRYVYDASHVWVKNVTFGYTFPKSLAFINSARLYLSADNLFLLTDYPGNNPDVNMRGGISLGIDDETYPVPRTLSIGTKLTF
jgi:TonB-linked SusC/RagA family outer membrane protein